MITGILVTAGIISIILNIFTFLIIGIQSNKVQTYEEYILNFKNSVEITLEKMRDIDKAGTFSTRINAEGIFESDDQVGIVFKDLEALLEDLNKIIE
jgi:hypothetical protein